MLFERTKRFYHPSSAYEQLGEYRTVVIARRAIKPLQPTSGVVAELILEERERRSRLSGNR